MSLSRSPICTHHPGSPSVAVDCLRFCSQRTLSLCSIGTRVELIFFFSAALPLNFFRFHNLMTAKPRGRPSLVMRDLNASGCHTRYQDGDGLPYPLRQ